VPAAIRGARVLVADPSEHNRTGLVEWLSYWGARVDVTGTWEMARRRMRLAASTGDPVRVAIVAEGLAGGDGAALVSALRAEPDLAGTQVLLTGSRLAMQDYPAFEAAGASGWLPRPWRAPALAAQLGELLTRTGTSGFLARETGAGEPALALRDDLGGVAAGAAAARDGGGPRVLVVEDNLTNQKVAARMLQYLGCTVSVANTGREGVEAFAREPFDCVFMDCQMPEMDGYEATSRIRALEGEHGHTPIVALTANAMEGDRERCLDSGMDDFLSKPIRREQLQGMLERWCPAAGREAA
jgi:CheY-like chemotaxis protein